jgi:hypothetical protein
MLELTSIGHPGCTPRAPVVAHPLPKGDVSVTGVARNVKCLTVLLLLAGGVPAAAQQTPRPAATLRATGAFPSNGSFTGTLTINRFEQRAGQIVAVGLVQGTLSRANRTIGTALATEVAWPVKVSAGGGLLAGGTSAAVQGLADVRWQAEAPPLFRMMRVQAQGCTPLQVNLGAMNVDLLGVQVALDPVGLTLNGAANTPLGDLVCAASDLLGNVAGLVTLLNNLLGVVTGLLGGLTGGLAGIGA